MQEEMRSKNICAQMEFYFGDSNLRYDKFLRDLISKDPAGFVELAVLSKFRKLQKLASGDVSIISEACKSSDLLQLSEDEAKIKRRFPVPLVEDSEVIARTLYLENFPKGFEHDDLRALFSEFGEVRHVSMPRNAKTRSFKGFAFVEMGDSLQKECAINSIDKSGGLKMWAKRDWLQRKHLYRSEFTHNGSRREGLVSTSTIKGGSATSFPPDDCELSSKSRRENFVPGLIIIIRGIVSGTKKHAIFEACRMISPVAYVDYSPRSEQSLNEARVRFASSTGAHKALVHFTEHPLYLNGVSVTLELLSGEAEYVYWNQIRQQQMLRRVHANERYVVNGARGGCHADNTNGDEAKIEAVSVQRGKKRKMAGVFVKDNGHFDELNPTPKRNSLEFAATMHLVSVTEQSQLTTATQVDTALLKLDSISTAFDCDSILSKHIRFD